MKKKIVVLSIASIMALSTAVMAASPVPPISTVTPTTLPANIANDFNKVVNDDRVLSYDVIAYDDSITVETFEDETIKANTAYKLTYNPTEEGLTSTDLAVVFEFTTKQFEDSSFVSTTAYDIKKTDDYVYVVIPNMTLSFKYPESPENAEKYTQLLLNASDAVVPNRLSTEYNRVEGLYTNYMLNLNEDMTLLAINDTYNDTTGALEKIIFKFSPMNRMEMPATIMEFYVYDREDYTEVKGIEKIKDANGLIFAVKVNTENPYKVEMDSKRYDEYVTMLTDNDYENIINSITLPQISDNRGAGIPPATTESEASEINTEEVTTTDVKEKTKFIVIDGVQSEIEYVTIGEGRKGVPARDMLEALGYEISWNANTKTVSFMKDKLSGSMTIGSLQYTYLKSLVRMDMAPIILNEVTVVPIEFLGQVLPYSYEIKADGNLYLNTNAQ